MGPFKPLDSNDAVPGWKRMSSHMSTLCSEPAICLLAENVLYTASEEDAGWLPPPERSILFSSFHRRLGPSWVQPCLLQAVLQAGQEKSQSGWPGSAR